jgi:hypothetical protein
VNTDPRDYVAEASEFTGKTSMKTFLLGLFSLRRMRFDPSTLGSQPSTAADISPSSSRLAKSFGVVIPTFFLKAHRRRRRKLGPDGAAAKLARRGGLPRSFVAAVSSDTRNVNAVIRSAAFGVEKHLQTEQEQNDAAGHFERVQVNADRVENDLTDGHGSHEDDSGVNHGTQCRQMPLFRCERSGQPGEKRHIPDRIDRRPKSRKILADFD